MKKTILIDLKDVENDSDLMYRFYQSLGEYYELSEVEWTERIRINHAANWHAFKDNLAGIALNDPDIQELEFIVANTAQAEENLSQETMNSLLRVLSRLTDPAQRVDGLSFTFQIRLKSYEPEQEIFHLRLHRGLPDGKDINN